MKWFIALFISLSSMIAILDWPSDLDAEASAHMHHASAQMLEDCCDTNHSTPTHQCCQANNHALVAVFFDNSETSTLISLERIWSPSQIITPLDRPPIA